MIAIIHCFATERRLCKTYFSQYFIQISTQLNQDFMDLFLAFHHLFHELSWKSIHFFLTYSAYRQTNKHTNCRGKKHNLLGKVKILTQNLLTQKSSNLRVAYRAVQIFAISDTPSTFFDRVCHPLFLLDHWDSSYACYPGLLHLFAPRMTSHTRILTSRDVFAENYLSTYFVI